MSFTDNSKEFSTNKRKRVTFSPVNSVVSYASTSTTASSSTSSTLSRSSSSTNWLPPISTLLSHISEHNEPAIVSYDYDPTFQFQRTIEPHIVLPKQKKRKTQTSKKPQQSQPQRQEQRRSEFMPMIPYYFHHEKFGIEACMLQLEGQKKFKNYFYI